MRAAEVEVCLCCYEKDECMWIVRRPHEGRVCVCVSVCMNHLNKLLAGFSDIFGWCTCC